jgi:hypothetical protein
MAYVRPSLYGSFDNAKEADAISQEGKDEF